MRKRIGTILMFAGSAALVWCLTVLAGAALYQHYVWRQLSTAPAVEHQRHAPRLHEAIGRLEIPRLHVSTVVLEGDDNYALRLGAGHVPETALPDGRGNVGIAAHRDTFFRPLRKIRPADRIELITPGGTYTYSVESTKIVGPEDTAVLRSTGGEELTLITCYPFYYVGSAPKRFVVRAVRVSRQQAPLSAG